MQYAKIIGTGSYLPEKVLTNAELEKIVETNDEWIRERSGITQRHIAADNENSHTLAEAAGRDAMAHAGISPDELDLIIVATATPNQYFPSTACLLQQSFGVSGFPAFDLNAACSGFIYALNCANSMIQTGMAKKALVVGVDVLTRLTDWTDRRTCILFGDGAGAAVLQASDEPGILATQLGADGTCADLIYSSGQISRPEVTPGYIRMEGREVYKRAVKTLEGMVTETLARGNIQADEIDWLIPHQANIRIIQSTAKHLNLPMERVIVTIADQGNTSAASIPLALDHGIKSGQVKPGELLFLEAFGAGLTWGCTLIRY